MKKTRKTNQHRVLVVLVLLLAKELVKVQHALHALVTAHLLVLIHAKARLQEVVRVVIMVANMYVEIAVTLLVLGPATTIVLQAVLVVAKQVVNTIKDVRFVIARVVGHVQKIVCILVQTLVKKETLLILTNG